jgi:hypothetical protein
VFVTTNEAVAPALRSFAVEHKPGSEEGALEHVETEDSNGRVEAEGLECWQSLLSREMGRMQWIVNNERQETKLATSLFHQLLDKNRNSNIAIGTLAIEQYLGRMENTQNTEQFGQEYKNKQSSPPLFKPDAVTLNYRACGYNTCYKAVTSRVQKTTHAGHKPSSQ